MSEAPLVLNLCAAVLDAAGTRARPGAIAVQGDRVLASGEPSEVRRRLGRTPDREIDHGDVLILPAFVNAHAHLDLAGLGPRVYDGDFTAWAMDVARRRPRSDAELTHVVVGALRASRDQGVGWIGDIAGGEAAITARLASDDRTLPGGVSWLECFGIGRAQDAAADAATERLRALRELPSLGAPLRVDLQPHAPYSAGRAVYARAAGLGAPSTHLAETVDELRFVRDASGPFAELLRSIGKWDDSIVGIGASPVRALSAELGSAPWVLAHCNHLDDDDVTLLASLPEVSVAYCPVASEYFGHRGHRYRELLARGVNVCLGTDSVLCQPADQRQPHGILAQMRRLWRRDRTGADTLLAMATRRGAIALRLGPQAATLTTGAPARMCAVPIDASRGGDPWIQVLDGDADATVIA